MVTSDTGIKFIKKHEGLCLEAYLCPAGVWTIGYGHTSTAKEGMVITEAEAETLLRKDLKMFENSVNSYGLAVNQNQFDALVSLCYNIGPGNFKKSTVLRLVKEHPSSPDIPAAFALWNKGGGKILPGLVRRRKEETALYFS